MSRTRGAVAAGHKETVRAARTMLEAGGNAVDAALAGFAAACVAEPVLASLGGGGYMLVRDADGEARFYDFVPMTPARRPDAGTCDFYPVFADFGAERQEFHIGRASIAVPGTPAGLILAHGEHRRLPLDHVLAPAIDLARRGVAMDAFQTYLFEVVSPIYLRQEEARALYESRRTPGRTLEQGEMLSNPELATAFESLIADGADAFYRGEIAARIVDACAASGLVSAADLDAYRAEALDPVTIPFGDATITTAPARMPGGVLVLLGLRFWETAADGDPVLGSAARVARLAGIMAATAQARADSRIEFEDRDAEAILGADFIAAYSDRIVEAPLCTRGTTQISVIDESSMAVSLTVSNGEGSGHIVPGTGAMLNNMLGEEDINPAGFHNWAPRVHLRSMMAPTIVETADGRLLALGSGGSNRIRTAILQVLLHLLNDGMDLRDAVLAPRIHYEGGCLRLEPGLDDDAIAAIDAAFDKVVRWDDRNLYFGGVHAVAFDRGRGTFEAFGDPRRDGAVEIVD